MNHLAHLALAGEENPLIIGSFLGDFVKGRLDDRYPADITIGIRLHRAIDAFTDHHPTVRQATGRFDSPYRRYAGIITDVMFDHLLAQQWPRYYSTNLNDFSRQTLAVLVDHPEHLPDAAHLMAQRMQSYNSLAGYGDLGFLDGALARLSARLTRDNPLNQAFDICVGLLPDIENDFLAFYPELQSFCHRWLQEAKGNTSEL